MVKWIYNKGRNEFDYLGIHVSNAGDINNDGIDDIVLGASVDNSSNGGEERPVIFGDENGFNSNFDLYFLTEQTDLFCMVKPTTLLEFKLAEQVM